MSNLQERLRDIYNPAEEAPDKFSFDEGDFTYYVDPCAGTVAAVMKKPMEHIEPILRKTIGSLEFYGGYDRDFCFSCYISQKIEAEYNKPLKGVAKVYGSDIFDLDTGMKIAREKALTKFYKRVTRLFVSINNEIESRLDIIENSLITYTSLYKKFSK